MLISIEKEKMNVKTKFSIGTIESIMRKMIYFSSKAIKK